MFKRRCIQFDDFCRGGGGFLLLRRDCCAVFKIVVGFCQSCFQRRNGDEKKENKQTTVYGKGGAHPDFVVLVLVLVLVAVAVAVAVFFGGWGLGVVVLSPKSSAVVGVARIFVPRACALLPTARRCDSGT